MKSITFRVSSVSWASPCIASVYIPDCNRLREYVWWRARKTSPHWKRGPGRLCYTTGLRVGWGEKHGSAFTCLIVTEKCLAKHWRCKQGRWKYWRKKAPAGAWRVRKREGWVLHTDNQEGSEVGFSDRSNTVQWTALLIGTYQAVNSPHISQCNFKAIVHVIHCESDPSRAFWLVLVFWGESGVVVVRCLLL